jgi:type IV pilus assembly protein PilC
MARIGTKPLAALCRRVAIALESGIDERRIWQREAERASGQMQAAVGRIQQAVERGQSAGDGVGQTGSYFPRLFHELVQLGDRTGKSATVFRRLADHYDHRLQLRRAFLAGITWPLMQLIAAVVVVGFLIWILGAIADNVGDAPYDILGLGLQGNRGLLIYVTLVAVAGGMCVAGYYLLRSGAAWVGPVQQLVMRLPAIGNCVRTLALSRLAWTLGLSLEAGMDLRRALPLALQSTHNAYFTRHIPDVQASVNRGQEAFVALAQTGVFPNDFLDSLQVGEQSGRLEEAMLRLADQYQDRARAALATLTTLAGFAVWAFVALIIIAIIISIVSSYAGLIQDMAR